MVSLLLPSLKLLSNPDYLTGLHSHIFKSFLALSKIIKEKQS